jgi:hypothetical protein
MTMTNRIPLGGAALGAVLLISLLGWAGAGSLKRLPERWKGSWIACLTDCLGSKDVTTRRCAAWALGRLGPAGEDALPPLNCALYYDPDRTVRRCGNSEAD